MGFERNNEELIEDKKKLFKLFFVWNKSKIRDFEFCPYYFKLR